MTFKKLATYWRPPIQEKTGSDQERAEGPLRGYSSSGS